MTRHWFAAALLLAVSGGAALAADPVAGERVFKSQCGICHSAAKGKNAIGPSLFGVYGTKAGEVPGFKFTAANKNSGLVFDDATLERYLENPKAVVPGTTMTYAGLKNPEQRANVIAYLATLH